MMFARFEEIVSIQQKDIGINLRSTPESVPHFCDEKNVEMFSRYGVYSETELKSRVEILLDEYCKTISIEALTMIDMAKKDILPAAAAYIKELSQTAALAKELGADNEFETDLIKRISVLASQTYRRLGDLEDVLAKCKEVKGVQALANYYHDKVFPAMGELRASADGIEALVGEKYWPYPTYGALLFYVM